MSKFFAPKYFFLPLFAFLVKPAAVEAHVTIDLKKAVAGEYAKINFRVPHGCEGSATTKITITIPEGSLSVKPQVHPGWKITMKNTKLAKPAMLHGKEVTESVSEITWTGGPLSDDHMDEFGVSLKLPEKPTDRLIFPILQTCKKGSIHWAEVAKGEHAHHGPQFPAPYLVLESAAATSTGK